MSDPIAKALAALEALDGPTVKELRRDALERENAGLRAALSAKVAMPGP